MDAFYKILLKTISLLFLLFLGAIPFLRRSWRRFLVYAATTSSFLAVFYVMQIYWVFAPVKGPPHPEEVPRLHALVEAKAGRTSLIYYPNFPHKDLIGLYQRNEKVTTEDFSKRKVVLFLHGRAQSIAVAYKWSAHFCKEIPCDLLVADYRGYGENAGLVHSTKGLYRDAEAAYQFLLAQGYLEENIILFGYSMGGVPAFYLAKKHQPAAVIIKSAFTHLEKAISHTCTYMWVPTWFTEAFIFPLLFFQMNNVQALDKIKSPLLLIYSKDDVIVPHAHGEYFCETLRKLKVPVDFITFHGEHYGYPEWLNSNIVDFFHRKQILPKEEEATASQKK